MTEINSKRKADIPKDSVFWAEKDSVQRGWINADKLLEKPPAKLGRWMKLEGFLEIPPRKERRYQISNRLKRDGLWESSAVWRKNTVREFLRWNLELMTLPAARELVWRALPEKAYQLGKDVAISTEAVVENQIPEEVITGMEFLPPWARWCVHHPGLLHTAEEVLDDVVLEDSCKRYLELCPCPHQAAMTQFQLYRGDRKLIDGLFKEIFRLHTVAVKNGSASDKAGTPEDSEEQREIATLEGLFGATDAKT